MGSDGHYYGCCEWVCGAGRCHYAGTIRDSAGGRRYCSDHHWCHDAVTGAQIVVISHRDCPYPDWSAEAISATHEKAFQRAMKESLKNDGLWLEPQYRDAEYYAMIRKVALERLKKLNVGRPRQPGEDDE